MRTLIVVFGLLLVTTAVQAEDLFDPGVSVDISVVVPLATDDNEPGISFGVAFTAFGNRVRGGGLGLAALYGPDPDEPWRSSVALALYAPFHMIAFGGPDCAIGYGDDCREGGIAVHVSPYWAPGRDSGLMVGISFIKARGR